MTFLQDQLKKTFINSTLKISSDTLFLKTIQRAPQQANAYDCGIFVLEYMVRLSRYA